MLELALACPEPLPVLVLLPVLMWGCGLPLLVPPWLAPLLPVLPAPEPVPVPVPLPVLVPVPVVLA